VTLCTSPPRCDQGHQGSSPVTLCTSPSSGFPTTWELFDRGDPTPESIAHSRRTASVTSRGSRATALHPCPAGEASTNRRGPCCILEVSSRLVPRLCRVDDVLVHDQLAGALQRSYQDLRAVDFRNMAIEDTHPTTTGPACADIGQRARTPLPPLNHRIGPPHPRRERRTGSPPRGSRRLLTVVAGVRGAGAARDRTQAPAQRRELRDITARTLAQRHNLQGQLQATRCRAAGGTYCCRQKKRAQDLDLVPSCA
jgi:hypothetical protein